MTLLWAAGVYFGIARTTSRRNPPLSEAAALVSFGSVLMIFSSSAWQAGTCGVALAWMLECLAVAAPSVAMARRARASQQRAAWPATMAVWQPPEDGRPSE